MRKLLFVLATILFAVSPSMAKTDPSKVTSVYLYGLSSSFNDSTVYITDIQLLDSAYLVNKKFLGGRKEYCSQLHSYLTEKGHERRTNVVFFYTNAKKAEKAHAKLVRRYTTSDIDLRTIAIEDFLFKSVRPDVDDIDTPAVKTKKEKKPARPKGAPDGKRPPMGGKPQGSPGGMGGPDGPGGGM